MRTAFRLTLLFALIGALLTPTQATSAPSGCASNWFEVYEISMKTDREVYRLGDTALVSLKVRDAATGTAVSDADVAVGAIVERYFYTHRMGRTNDKGVAELRLELDRGTMKPGWADLRAMARTYFDEGDAVCAGVGLYGFKEVKRAFRITR